MAKITEKIVTIKDRGAELEREVREKTIGYILTSFGLVAGMAWNDAIKSLIEKYSSGPSNGLQAKFLYAVLLTIIVVAVSLYLSRIFHVQKKDKEKDKDDSGEKKEKTEKKSAKKK